MKTHKSFCRFCHANCAIEVDVDDGLPVAVRGDATDPVYGGYTCLKGRELPAQYVSQDRIRRSLRREHDGSHREITTSAAMDEIADKIQDIISRHGPRAVATYVGTYGYQNMATMSVARAWHQCIGSSSFYTSVTIDQPGKRIAAARIGTWNGGTHAFSGADVCMIIGSNPVVSQYSRFGGPPPFSPYARIRDEMKRGMKLIVVDPRRTEVANRASLHLQIDPGEDATLLCGLIRVVLGESLHDEAFCSRYVDGLDQLKHSVAPFTPDHVAERCGLLAEQVVEAAHMFAAAKRGVAVGGTGPAMAPNNVLTEHLILTLNYLCGRVNREGERVLNAGILMPIGPRTADVQPAAPVHGLGPAARVRGLGEIFGEMPTATLSDEILLEGDGQIRALICLGGNPVLAFPDQDKTRRAMEKLDLLVCVDLYRSATAQLADYVIAPTVTLEREEATLLTDGWYDVPYANYTTAVLPKQGDTLEEWEVYWELAQRSGLTLDLPGGALVPDKRPTKLEVLKCVAPRSRVPLEALREHGSGQIYPEVEVRVAPSRPGADARLQLAPDGVSGEIAALLEPQHNANRFTHRLISRRLKHVFNSSGQKLENLRRKGSTNPAFMHPEDLAALGITSGDLVRIESAAGTLVGVAEAANDIKPGVVSMAHGWGDLPEHAVDVRTQGASTNRLIDDDRTFDPITGQPVMSAVPVSVQPLGAT